MGAAPRHPTVRIGALLCVGVLMAGVTSGSVAGLVAARTAGLSYWGTSRVVIAGFPLAVIVTMGSGWLVRRPGHRATAGWMLATATALLLHLVGLATMSWLVAQDQAGRQLVSWLALAGQLAGQRNPDLVGWNAETSDVRVFAHSGRKNLGRTVDTGITLDGINLLLNVGDWNGDGRGDFMTRRSSGAMMFYAGRGRNRFAAPVVAAADWSRVGLVTAGGDVTGDGFPDLLGRDAAGYLRVYPSNGGTGFRPDYVAHSWIDADRQVGVGLLDDDGAPDTVLRRRDGTLWLWSGNGPGGLVTGRQVGSGAARYDWLRGYGDVNGGGRIDVIARTRGNGKLWLLPGTRRGFADRRLIGVGFDAYDFGG